MFSQRRGWGSRDMRVTPKPELSPGVGMRKAEEMKRRGFTLVETVVTVGIIAALAAVVYPTVVKQFDSADPTRAAEDLGNIRTAEETFGVNVRPELPGDLEDLINRPDGAAGADRSSQRVAYTDAEAAA